MNSQELREAFAGLSTPLVADACSRLGVVTRVAPPGIRPLLPHHKVAGRALPLRYDGAEGPLPELIRMVEPGDVLVIDNRGRVDEGCIGELLALEAQKIGVGGIAVWGAHRDAEALAWSGLPIFSYGPCTAKPRHPVEPPPPPAPPHPRFGDFGVGRDDFVFADAGGVVFVNEEVLAGLLRAAASIGETERGRAEAVRGGMGLRGQLWLDDFLMSRMEGGRAGCRQRWEPVGGPNAAEPGGAHG